MATPVIVSSRQAFQDKVIAGVPAYWIPAPGMLFRVQQQAQAQGLGLRLEPQILDRAQLNRALERRFEQPQDYARCYLFFDPERALVIWQALPPFPDATALDALEAAALSLAGLERPGTLFPHAVMRPYP